MLIMPVKIVLKDKTTSSCVQLHDLAEEYFMKKLKKDPIRAKIFHMEITDEKFSIFHGIMITDKFYVINGLEYWEQFPTLCEPPLWQTISSYVLFESKKLGE